jgi:hypothetical protein
VFKVQYWNEIKYVLRLSQLSFYVGKSLNNRNFILKCMEKYTQRKILFWDTKWMLKNMSYGGHANRAVWACATARPTWPLHCQLALWKSNEAVSVFFFCFFCGWSEGMKHSEIYRTMKVHYGDCCLSQGRVYEWVERFKHRWRSNGSNAKLAKGIHKLVDRWVKCVVKKGSMLKNKTQTISTCTLVKNYYIIPLFTAFPSYFIISNAGQHLK